MIFFLAPETLIGVCASRTLTQYSAQMLLTRNRHQRLQMKNVILHKKSKLNQKQIILGTHAARRLPNQRKISRHSSPPSMRRLLWMLEATSRASWLEEKCSFWARQRLSFLVAIQRMRNLSSCTLVEVGSANQQKFLGFKQMCVMSVQLACVEAPWLLSRPFCFAYPGPRAFEQGSEWRQSGGVSHQLGYWHGYLPLCFNVCAIIGNVVNCEIIVWILFGLTST